MSEASRRHLCEYLAEAWDPAEPLPEDLRTQLEARALEAIQREPEPGSGQARLTPAEISQRSVDLLLREYYKMVQAQQHTAAKPADATSGLLQRLFLLLCPTGPACCDLQHLVSAAAYVVKTAAWLVVLLGCLIVPAWLALIRELLQQQQLGQAAALAMGGLAVLLACDAVHRQAAAARAAAAAATVTAATVRRCLPTGPASAELATLRQSSKTVTTSLNNSRHSLGQQQLHAMQQQQQQHHAASSSPVPPGSSSGQSYLSLLPALAALQSALGVSGEPPTSREQLSGELRRLCGVLGLEASPDMLASPAAMAATIGRLKTQIGI